MSRKIEKRHYIYTIGIPIVILVLLLQIESLMGELEYKNDYLQATILNVSTQKALQRIDSERQTSLNKIMDIMARYNQAMPIAQRKQIAREIYNMSKKYPNLNIDFIAATITHESANTWDPNVVSHVGAIGLMQIMPSTGQFLAGEEGIEWTGDDILFDPLINIRLGCRYLSEMVTMYEHDGGLAAYNAGPRIAQLWLASNRNNDILWEETRGYVPAILKLYAEFQTEDALF